MGAGKNADSLELARLELERSKVARGAARDQAILTAVKWIGVVLATWVPLSAVQPIAASLAGKQTEFSGGLSISLMYSGVATVGWAVCAARSRTREKSLLKLRARAGRMGLDLDARRDLDEGGGE